MIGKLTPDDNLPNSDELFCENCENIVDTGSVRLILKDGDYVKGCSECTDRCLWCGNYYLREDMYDNPYLGFCCNACLSAEDYNKASDAEILKDALAGLFFSTESREIEDLVIKLIWKKGYYELADGLKSDQS